MNDELIIKDFVQPFDEVAEADFNRIDKFVQSDLFLRSLGSRQFESEAPKDIPIVCDIARAEYLMMSQEMWNEDDADEKYYAGIVEDSVKLNANYSKEECKARTMSYMNNSSKYMDALFLLAAERLSELNALEKFLPNCNDNLKTTDMEYFFSHDLPNEIGADLDQLILGAQIGGLHFWPIADYLCKVYEWGYMPCGWIGPLPEDGGDPRKCMQMLALSCER
ncbi:MAG: hypothetical protein CSB44_05130 [Gammaproteobacteria bacterium]|nr:MAG: hypothetical protein CSB44_05130 [Gammaproteobacteria bacterium]